MKTYVAIAKASGELLCVTPLYPIDEQIATSGAHNILISAIRPEPMAYIVDINDGQCPILNAKVVDKYIEILGEL